MTSAPASEKDVLAEITAAKRKEVERRKQAQPFAALQSRALGSPPPRGFAAKLKQIASSGGPPALIAEMKKASPSRGLIRADFEPAALARAYRDGGAACLSVLTDTPYFQGSDEHLVEARMSVNLPILRKDFMVDPYQVYEARAIGADCILVIMASLDDATARGLAKLARNLGLDVLAEVHDEKELDRALAIDGALLGINNRDLKTLMVDLATFERLAPRVPKDRFLVAESGIKTAADIARLERAGARAYLVGESLMSQADVNAATRSLLARVVAPA
jgi:indole-3-glycerol phosphate synthase